MSFPHYYNSYEQLKRNPTHIAAALNSAEMIRNACFNNDYLLKLHGITFATLIRYFAERKIDINRRTYEKARIGDIKGVNTIWIGYLLQFWREKGYHFSLQQFCDPDIEIS